MCFHNVSHNMKPKLKGWGASYFIPSNGTYTYSISPLAGSFPLPFFPAVPDVSEVVEVEEPGMSFMDAKLTFPLPSLPLFWNPLPCLFMPIISDTCCSRISFCCCSLTTFALPPCCCCSLVTFALAASCCCCLACCSFNCCTFLRW